MAVAATVHRKNNVDGNDSFGGATKLCRVKKRKSTEQLGNDLFTITPDWVARQGSEREEWGLLRRTCACILEAEYPHSKTNIFDTVIGAMIFFNIIIMIIETDQTASCDELVSPSQCIAPWVNMVNAGLLGVYTLEIFMRLQVQRLAFFFRGWNLLDSFIVVSGCVSPFLSDTQLSNVEVLRLARVMRLIRVAKLLNKSPSLRSMIMGFAGAMTTMMWGLILIVVLLVLWSILVVELANPVNKSLYKEGDTAWCAVAFSSVARSTLHFFQTLVAGDSWGSCTIPVIQQKPSLCILFALALASVHLGFTNLVLATIVDRAAEAREDSRERKKENQFKKEQQSIELWRETLKKLDRDGSGAVTLQELMHGYKTDDTVKDVLGTLQIREDDLHLLFKLMDADNSGTVSYDEFCNAFHKAYTQDWRGYLMMLTLNLQYQNRSVSAKLSDIETQLEDKIKRIWSQHSAVPELAGFSGLHAAELELDSRKVEASDASGPPGSESRTAGTFDWVPVRPHTTLITAPVPKQTGSQTGSLSKTRSAGCLDWTCLRQQLETESDDKVMQEGAAGVQAAKSLRLNAFSSAPPPPPIALPPFQAPSAPAARGAVAATAGATSDVDATVDTRFIAELQGLHHGLEARLQMLVADAAATTEVLTKQRRLLQSVGRQTTLIHDAREHTSNVIGVPPGVPPGAPAKPVLASTSLASAGSSVVVSEGRSSNIASQRASTARLEATVSVMAAELGYRCLSTSSGPEEVSPHASGRLAAEGSSALEPLQSSGRHQV